MSSAPRTGTEAGWLFGLLQASDTFYPTGAYAHSFGLEGLVEEGVVRDRETLRRFILLSVLPTLRNVELPLAAHAWRGFAARDWAAIGELCVLASALRAPREARAASEAIGRQRAELAASLHDSSLARDYLGLARSHAWPHCSAISAALEARVHGAPLEAALASVAYAAIAGVISAAMKVLRLGQNGAQSLLTEALSLCPPLVESALAVPLAEIGWFNPWLDVAASRHEHASARLFIS